MPTTKLQVMAELLNELIEKGFKFESIQIEPFISHSDHITIEVFKTFRIEANRGDLQQFMRGNIKQDKIRKYIATKGFIYSIK